MSKWAYPVWLFSMIVAVGVCPADETKPYVQVENLVYHEVHGIGLLMDTFTPTGPKNGMAIVDVVSGSFFSDRGKLSAHVKFKVYDEFCSHGYTVFAVRPGSMTKFAIPEMADHIKLGIRWVRLHAKEYGIESDKIGIVGASAGGHLASLVALTGDDGSPTAKIPILQPSCRVHAAAVFFPPTDFLSWGGRDIDTDANPGIPIMFKNIIFAGPAVPRSPERLREQVIKISPVHQVHEDSPPFLVIHGDADPVVPLQQSEVFVAKLKEKGVPCQFIIKPGGTHPWPTMHEEVKIAVDWMDRQLRGESVVGTGS